MKIWLVCFIALFALAELFDWVKEFSLPLPIYILGGAFLAIASNYNKLINTYNPTASDVNMGIINEVTTQTNQLTIESASEPPISLNSAEPKTGLQASDMADNL